MISSYFCVNPPKNGEIYIHTLIFFTISNHGITEIEICVSIFIFKFSTSSSLDHSGHFNAFCHCTTFIPI